MRTLTLVVCVCVCVEKCYYSYQVVDLLHFSIAAEIESIRVWFVLGSRLWLDIATCENDLYLCSLTCCVLWVMNSTHLSRLCVPRWSSSVCTAIDAQSSTVLYTYWNSETSFFRSLWKHLVLGGKQTLRPCGLPAHSEAVGVGGFWIRSIGTALSSILLHSWHFLLTCAIPIDHNVQWHRGMLTLIIHWFSTLSPHLYTYRDY